MENPFYDFLAYWKRTDKEKKTCRNHVLNYEPIQVRVSKIKLKSGEIEILISSLYQMDIYTLDDMKELYRLRWGIEEGFIKLKPKMKIK
jgi:IS4 transposase